MNQQAVWHGSQPQTLRNQGTGSGWMIGCQHQFVTAPQGPGITQSIYLLT